MYHILTVIATNTTRVILDTHTGDVGNEKVMCEQKRKLHSET